MQRKIVRIFLFAFLSAASALPAFAADVTYTVTMPHYNMDGKQFVGVPTFVVHDGGKPSWAPFTSGDYMAFESSPYQTTDNFKCQNLPEGYYGSKWEVLTQSGKSLFSTDQELATVQFPYSWYKQYGEKQLMLIVSIDQKQFTVSYDANGGKWNGAEPQPKTYKYNETGTALSRTAAVREGYEPTGWNTMPDGSGTSAAFSSEFSGKTFGITAKENDIVLYAQWKAKPYTATIASGEGGSGGCAVGYSYSESQQTKVITLPAREGYGISGWTATGYSGSAPTIQDNVLTIPAKTSGGFTMTPTWKANAYSLSVERGVGIDQIAVDYVRDGKACHDTTSYGTSYEVDYGTRWSAYAVAATGYATNATCAASGTMTTAGATFAPNVTCRDFNLRLSLGEGIAVIWYRVGVSSEWSGTTHNLVVPVAYGATWQAYAEAAEGYGYTATSRERPTSGTMTTGGASFEPVGTLNQYPLSLELGPGIVKIYCDYTNNNLYCHAEITSDKTVAVDFGTWWHARGVVADHGETNATCEASRRMGSGGDRFAPTATLAPQPLTLTKGTGIAEIYYRTNGVAWIAAKGTEETVYVMYDATWSAYAVASPGYAYSKTSREHPYTARMAAGGAVFAPAAAANAIWVRYDRNGGGDAGRMDDSEFAYGVEAPLRLNAYARSYEVHYNGNGGTCAHENDVSGYAFAGWRDTPEGLTGTGHYSYSDGQRVRNPCGSTGASASDPVILYAQWTPKAVTLPLPMRAGCDFSGWYTLREGGQRVGGAGETYAATDDITLYAHWRAHVTKLRFVVGGEEVADYAHAVANGKTYGEFGSLPELTSDDPKKLFLGWYTAPEGGTRIADTTTVDLTGDTVVLYAQWETVTYAITYETNGGTIDEYAKTGYNKGQSFALPTAVTRTDGRIFLGWYDNPTFEGEAVERIASTDSGDKTFWAKWSEASTDKVTLTFVNVTGYEYFTNKSTHAWGWKTLVDETTPILTQTYAKGATVTLPDALFTQDGYRQVGWRRAGDSHVNPDKWEAAGVGDAIGVVAQDRTYHTIWETNTYTVMYDSRKAIRSPTVKYGAAVQSWVWDETKLEYRWVDGLPKDDDKEYEVTHQFVGWAMNKDGHAIYQGGEIVSNLTAKAGGTVTLYAVWTPKNSVMEETSSKSAPKLATAMRTPLLTVNPQPSTLNPQPTYTLHFSPGADVVNPMGMTNWINCVSGEAITPDCLYTNLYSEGFLGWIYNGTTNKTVAPVATIDGQVITLQAAWKNSCGDLSVAAGLTNAVLVSESDPAWQPVGKPKPYLTCVFPDTIGETNMTSSLQMWVEGSGTLSFAWTARGDEDFTAYVDWGTGNQSLLTEGSEKVYACTVTGEGLHKVEWRIGVSKELRVESSFEIRRITWQPTSAKTCDISVSANPANGGTVTGGGTYALGATATLTAEADDGYAFVQWNDGSTNSDHTVTVWGDITNYVARFVRAPCKVTVCANPTEGGTVSGAGTYEYNTMTSVTATASTGWLFDGWSDGATENPHTITILSSTNLTATFRVNNYPLTLTVNEGVAKIWYEIGTAKAQSTTSTLMTNIAYGTSYRLWAEAKAGYDPQGSGWSREDAITGEIGTAGYEFSPNPDKRSYSVTTTVSPYGGGTVTGAGMHEYGKSVELEAAASTGWSFVGWGDGETENPHAITVLCATNLTATFQKNSYPLAFTINEGVAKIWYELGTAEAQSTTVSFTTNIPYGASYKVWAETKYGFALTGAGSSEATAVEGTMGTDGSAFSPTPDRLSYAVTTASAPSEGGEVAGARTYEYEAEAELVATEHEGYAFDRWSDGATENPHTITVLCVTNLTAMFSALGPKLYYIVYDGNGATGGAMGEQTNVCDEAAILCSNAFVRTGYVFIGWQDKNGVVYKEGQKIETDLAEKNRAALLRAIWKPVEYRIDFDENGGRGEMESVLHCSYGISYQLPDCTFTRDKETFVGWATDPAGAVVYKDGAIVRDLSATGGGVTLHAVWSGHGTKEVNITGHTATKHYTGRPFTVSGYDVEILSEGYYTKDFTVKPGTVTSITETDVKYDAWGNVAKYTMGLSSDSFTNLVSSVEALFNVEDGWLKILPSQIGGEPQTAVGSGLSAFDGEGTYGKPFDGSAISNAYAQAGYGVTQLEYAATEAGPWSANAPVMTVVGATSIWYRVSATGYEPYEHELAVKVKPRYIREATVAPIPDQEWTGDPLVPEPEVTADGTTLVKDADYYLTYANNADPGTATATVHGKGNWQGTTTANFKIVRVRDLEEDAAVAAIPDQTWTGNPVTPKVAVTVKGEGTTLAEGADYNLTYADNVNPGMATVDVVGTNSWRGTISATFKIIRTISGEPGAGKVPEGGLSKFDVTAEYDGKQHTVDAEALLKAYVDVYAGAQVAFGATAQGPWAANPIALVSVGTTSLWYRVTAAYCTTFTHEAKVTVTPRDLAKVTVAPIPDQTWTGKPIEPPVTVTDGRPSIVTAGDYGVAYSDNVDLGTATVTLTGKGNYAGTKTAQFKIVEKVRKPTRVTITGHVATNAYDGKAHTASGFDFDSTHAGYTRADFRCTAWTSVTRTALGTTFANLTAADFENLNDDFTAEFVVARDISVTVTTGTIPGEPGAGKVPKDGLSKYDATCVYDGENHTLNAEALTNAFAVAKYVVTNVAYAATAGGPWFAEPPAISDAGATSFWYRVSCENYEPFAHQAKVTVTPCATVVISVTGHVATNVYDGESHRVEGYDVSIAGSALYTEDDFAFSGRDYAERTRPGVTRYEMKAADFRNVNGNFVNVKFVIDRDGESAVVWEEPPEGVGEVGRYYGYTLVELGYDVTDATAVKAEGLPAGLALKKDSINGYWYVEGIPTATASTNGAQCAYLRITRMIDKAKVEEVVELPIEVREARVREIDPPAVLDKAYGPTPVDELWPEVAEAVEKPKDWSFAGWPTGIRYGKVKVVGEGEVMAVYGKATKAGVFTVTATRTVPSLFTTAKYKEKYYASFMTRPEEDAGIACTSTAYEAIEPVSWTGVKSASGLPTGLKYGSVKGGLEIYGMPTKSGVFAVARTYADRKKDTVLWQVLPGENGGATVDFGESKIEAGIVQVELGLPVTWPLAAAEGAKVTVSGLPTGLKYGKTKVEGEGEVMAVYGVPTRAGSYVVTVKTVANGVTVTQRFAVKATALPATMVGTYYGAATNALGTAEQFTLTIAATGKVSGNFYAQGKRVTFSAASLDRREADGRYVAAVTYKHGGETCADELVLAATNAVGGVDLWVASLGEADGVLVGVDARRDVIKDVCGKLEAKTYPIEDETFAEGEYLNAKVATSGAVTVAGNLLDANGKKVAVSCSTRLAVLDDERLGCWITIYKTVSRQPPITYVRFWELEY